ncbi:hypothetical protein [Pseudonocardia adelaidensis]|uniref:Uncharacterized protein n=1 Tax=Pseudonocardia adelaidensis TaxID=648754 RepID=A0ABP9NIZ5_9PSEU
MFKESHANARRLANPRELRRLVSAAIALFALIFAGLAAKATVQTNRAQQQTLELQRRQFEDSQHSALRAQAEKVAAWYELRRNQIAKFGAMTSDMFVLQNGSDLPIYDVWVAASAPAWQVDYIAVEHDDVIPPGTHDIEMTDTQELGQATHLSIRIIVLFRDAAGRYWIRRENGMLEESDEDAWDYERRVLDQSRDSNPLTANEEPSQ